MLVAERINPLSSLPAVVFLIIFDVVDEPENITFPPRARDFAIPNPPSAVIEAADGVVASRTDVDVKEVTLKEPGREIVPVGLFIESGTMVFTRKLDIFLKDFYQIPIFFPLLQ